MAMVLYNLQSGCSPAKLHFPWEPYYCVVFLIEPAELPGKCGELTGDKSLGTYQVIGKLNDNG